MPIREKEKQQKKQTKMQSLRVYVLKKLTRQLELERINEARRKIEENYDREMEKFFADLLLPHEVDYASLETEIKEIKENEKSEPRPLKRKFRTIESAAKRFKSE